MKLEQNLLRKKLQYFARQTNLSNLFFMVSLLLQFNQERNKMIKVKQLCFCFNVKSLISSLRKIRKHKQMLQTKLLRFF